MWVLRGLWFVFRELEVVAISVAPASASRAYIKWRLSLDVAHGNRCTLLTALASAERRLGNTHESEFAARESLRVAPDYWYAYAELARTLEALDRRPEALVALQTMLGAPGFDRKYERFVLGEIDRLAASRKDQRHPEEQ